MINILISGTVIVKNVPEMIIKRLKKELTFDNPEYKKRKDRGKPIPANCHPTIELWRSIGPHIRFPRGYMQRFMHHLGRREYHITDTTVLPPADISFKGTLRPYQEKAVKDCLHYRYGILEASTGSGKTVMAINYITRRNTTALVLVHSKELFDQWQERLDTFTDMSQFGLVGSGTKIIAPITVGIINSVHKIAPELRDKFGIVIYDECFVPGTLVDGRPIESILPGEYVESLNHFTGVVEKKKVVRVHKNPVTKSLITLRFSNGVKVTCTPNHPFYTPVGYLTADHLYANSTVYSIEHFDKDGHNEKLHMPQVRHKEHSTGTSQKETTQKGMPTMQDGPHKETGGGALQSLRFSSPSGTMEGKTVWCPLFGQVCSKDYVCFQEEEWQIPVGLQQEVCKSENEGEQSHAYEGGCGENEDHKTCQRYSKCMAWITWRQRSINPTTGKAGDRFGLGYRGLHKYETVYAHQEGSDLLQGGRGEQGVEGSCGNRWKGACTPNKAEAGQEKGVLLKEVRVESVEVHKPGSGREPEGVCRDGHVYNIEVEHNHNYFVEGILTHNCHRAMGTMWAKTSNTLRPKFQLGLSATPFRNDGLTAGLYRLIGPKLHRVDPAELEEAGAVLAPKICRVHTDFWFNWKEDQNYSKMIRRLTRDSDRNNKIIEAVMHDVRKYSDPVIVVSDRIEHCDMLFVLLSNAGDPDVRPVLVHGRMHKDTRVANIARMRNGRANILIATVSLLGEGFDAPDLSALFMTTPIKFKGRTIQIIGRILRPKEGKWARVYDFRDINIEPLRFSGFARDRVYKQSGWT